MKDCDIFKNPDSLFVVEKQEKGNLQSIWNKSSSNGSRNVYVEAEEEISKKKWKNDDKPVNKKNKSTLSLHIAAYENSIDGGDTVSFGVNEDLNGKEKPVIKKWKSINSTTIIQDSFEFPRQQTDKKTNPAIMHFTASQRLLNPNEQPVEAQQQQQQIPQRKISIMSCYFQDLLQKICKIASDPSLSFYNSINQLFKNLFSPDKECDCSYKYRQRTALVLVNLNYLRQSLFDISDDRVDKVIDVFMSICTKNMDPFKDKEGFWVFPLESVLNQKLLEDSLKVLCCNSPKKHMETIERIWCLNDETSGMKRCISEELKPQIAASPLLVIEWIECFKLYEFKTSNLECLALSCLVNNLDIKYLMTNDSFKDAILSLMDQFVERYRPQPLSTLHADFFNKFSAANLSTIVYKWANPDRLDKIPTTLEYRAIKNFDHNFSQAATPYDKRLLAWQTIEASKHSQSQIKEILKCIIKNGEEVLASALVSCVTLPMRDMLEILPQYHHMSPSTSQAVELEKQELKNLQSKSERIPFIEFDEFECFLVDDRESFDKLLVALHPHKTVAFDVEASFVCQSKHSNQSAALLQLAFGNDTVYLVDIYTLKKILNDSEWETFFELFLRPTVRRIGFDINNDLMFLQNAFSFLRKWFTDKKPTFACVQKAVIMLLNNQTTSKLFFGEKTPQISLQYITKELLDVELKKEEQSGNWLIRPLDERKMKYAATDAFYTLKCFFKIKNGLDKPQWMDMKKEIFKIREPVKAAEPNQFDLIKKKETFEEIIAHIQNVLEEIQPMIVRNANECSIVLDVPFLRFSVILKRLGFKTWDHRDASPKADKDAKQMMKEMESHFKGISKEKRALTYVLTNKKTLPPWLSTNEERIIYALQDASKNVVMENVLRKTCAAIDFSLIDKRCNSCAESDTHFEIPMAAFRCIYKSFATSRNFADSIVGLEDSLETFKDIFNSLSPELKSNCAIDGEELIAQSDADIYRFSINGSDCDVSVNNEVSIFKCDTKLFENKNGRDAVKFCRDCKCFF